MSDGLVFVRRIRRTPYSNRVEQAGVRGYSVKIDHPDRNLGLLYPKGSLSPATSRFIKYLEAEFKNLSNVIQRHEQNELWRRSTLRR